MSISSRGGPRPGGRSARIQASVHTATRELLQTMDRGNVTVPLIAAKAGVTPSTIYRRWGDLQQLLADIAVEQLRVDGDPADTGGGASDLLAWAEQFAEEFASGPGREILRDMLSAEPESCQCWEVTRRQIEIIAARAEERREAFPKVNLAMDRVVAPIICDILFSQPLHRQRIADLVTDAFRG
ncbi:MAG: TetR/AcrR family transcriptional regulator [Bradyrhizobium sp.]|nr:TetR/AcrR family transcriptional regulator [Bradyrhizobium sp.]